MFGQVYQGRRVLVTGHTGFKGSWLCAWLLALGAEVGGCSLDPPTDPSHYEVIGLGGRIKDYRCDVRDRDGLARVLDEFRPDMVFHLAAQALIRRSFQEPVLTFETNTMGTLNLLEGLRGREGIRAGVIITSDKAYLNKEWLWGYREDDTLGGDDPYSASKACAELVIKTYMLNFLTGSPTALVSARAGNVIGGGDWAADRIVPDCMRSWARGEEVRLRNPGATRPWQHVLEPLSGYLLLGQLLWEGSSRIAGQSFNFGPRDEVTQSVEELVRALASQYTGAQWRADRPEAEAPPENQLLKLCCDKALGLLRWRSVLSFAETMRFTAEWYRCFHLEPGYPMAEVTARQIEEYSALAKAAGLGWVQ